MLTSTSDIPVQAPIVVRRDGLGDALSADPEIRVVAVLAPLGYGKSTLLAQWAAEDPRPVAWVSLDARADDPVVLIAQLVAALERSGPVDQGVHEALAASGTSVWTILMPRLTRMLDGLPPTLIVLDDVHELGTGVASDIVAEVALRVPRGSQLVVAGRDGGRLPLSRLRLGGRLAELGVGDLALSDEEAFEIAHGLGVRITPEDAARLNSRCEGWAGGLRLSLMVGRAGDGTLPPIAPRGSHESISAYVRSEIIAGMPPTLVEFLLRTSVLRRLAPDLCDQVTDGTGSGETLRDLERGNVFVSALDPDHRWYRYHDLFREALLAELERREPALPSILRGRAAEWHARNGMAEDAVTYALEAGDVAVAAKLVGQLMQTHFNRGREATVLEWLAWAERSGLVGTDPSLTLGGALVYALAGEPERSETWAAGLEHLTWQGPLPDGSPGIEAWQAMARSAWWRSGVERALEDAERARELVPELSPWRSTTLVAAGLAYLATGRSEAAVEAFLTASDPAAAPRSPANARSLAMALLGREAVRRGEVAEARRWLGAADDVRSSDGLSEQGPQALVDALAARVALADGDRDEMARRLAHAQRLRPLLTWAIPSLAAIVRIDLAAVHLASADPAGARTLLLEIGDILRRRPGLGILEAEAEDLRARLSEIRDGVVGVSTLTTAELRLIPMLATHLTFQEIGMRLFVSTNTVKTQAMSVYRKLDASSRSEAVHGAVRAGLLDPAAVTAILTGATPD